MLHQKLISPGDKNYLMENKNPENLNAEELRETINLETGKIGWEELQRHFARGVVVVISAELDLIDVAAKFVEDNKPAIETWTKENKITRALDEHAEHWNEKQSEFWACVIAPWVLVQEITTEQ